jgi:hypothetical protein
MTASRNPSTTSDDQSRIGPNFIATLNRSERSGRTMNSNWKLLDEKWPKWKLDKSDQRVVDLSNCNFVGNGNHEIAVFTFPRYKRIAGSVRQVAHIG